MICWMDETRPLRSARKYAIKHTTRSARAVVRELHYRLDVNTLHRDEDADRAAAQRDRPGPAAHDGAAARRRVPAQPDHRRLHPHRRGHQPDRRRRHDRGGGLRPRTADRTGRTPVRPVRTGHGGAPSPRPAGRLDRRPRARRGRAGRPDAPRAARHALIRGDAPARPAVTRGWRQRRRPGARRRGATAGRTAISDAELRELVAANADARRRGAAHHRRGAGGRRPARSAR